MDYIKEADQFLIDTAYSHGYADNDEARKAILMFSKRLMDKRNAEEENKQPRKLELECSDMLGVIPPYLSLHVIEVDDNVYNYFRLLPTEMIRNIEQNKDGSCCITLHDDTTFDVANSFGWLRKILQAASEQT